MGPDLPQIIDSFPGLRVLVIGDAMLDTYSFGTSSRLCREAPVPIVALDDRWDMPGGAANTAINVGALGAQVSFISVTGSDAEAEALCNCLRAAGIDCAGLVAEP